MMISIKNTNCTFSQKDTLLWPWKTFPALLNSVEEWLEMAFRPLGCLGQHAIQRELPYFHVL